MNEAKMGLNVGVVQYIYSILISELIPLFWPLIAFSLKLQKYHVSSFKRNLSI